MDGIRIYSKLDRVMAYSQWYHAFPQIETIFDSLGVSDHAPVVVKVRELLNTGPKPFKFNQFLMRHYQYKEIINSVWAESIQRNPMMRLCVKLKKLKAQLRILNHKHFSAISERVQQAKGNLYHTQDLLPYDPFNNELHTLEKSQMMQYVELRTSEEQFYKTSPSKVDTRG